MTTESLSVTIEGELLTVEIGTVAAPAGGGGGSAAWGDITGTLSAQADLSAALALKAPIASPTLTGTPAAPTAAGGTSTTQIATTAFAAGEITTHAGATDPHGDRAFATSAVSTHNTVTTAHGISAFGATLVDDADAATARSTLGLGTAATTAATDYATAGHNHSGVYQPADAELTAIAGLVSAADKGIQFTGAGTAATFDLTAAGKALLDDADASAQRSTLGLGGAATLAVGTTAGTVAAGDDSRFTTAASTTVVGHVELATDAEVSTGTDTTRAMTVVGYKDSTPFYADRAADWTLALTDRNKDQWFNNGASALVCTIPLNATVAFAVGDTVPFVRLASGTATIDAATSVTLNGVSGGSCTISTRYQGALLKKIGTDSWIVSGDVSAVA